MATSHPPGWPQDPAYRLTHRHLPGRWPILNAVAHESPTESRRVRAVYAAVRGGSAFGLADVLQFVRPRRSSHATASPSSGRSVLWARRPARWTTSSPSSKTAPHRPAPNWLGPRRPTLRWQPQPGSRHGSSADDLFDGTRLARGILDEADAAVAPGRGSDDLDTRHGDKRQTRSAASGRAPHAPAPGRVRGRWLRTPG